MQSGVRDVVFLQSTSARTVHHVLKKYDFRKIILANYINSHTDAGDKRDFIVKTYDVMTSMLPKMYFLQRPRDSVSLLAE